MFLVQDGFGANPESLVLLLVLKPKVCTNKEDLFSRIYIYMLKQGLTSFIAIARCCMCILYLNMQMMPPLDVLHPLTKTQ